MNYKLILNETELQRFIDILPETTDDTRYYIALLARKKYDKSIKKEYKYFKKLLSVLAKRGYVVYNVRADAVWASLLLEDYKTIYKELNYLTDNLIEVIAEEGVVVTSYEVDKIKYYKITFKE